MNYEKEVNIITLASFSDIANVLDIFLLIFSYSMTF